MAEQLIHAFCGGNVMQNLEIDTYKCDKCEETGIAVEHTTEGGEEVILLKETTQEEVDEIEAAVEDN